MTGEVAAGTLEGLLARVRAVLGGFTRGSAGNRRTLLWYGLYTLAIFVLCLVATFPHHLLLTRVLREVAAQSTWQIETGSSRLGWTLAYAIDSLRVRMRDGEGDPLLAADALRLSPSRWGLVWGSPYPLGITATLYGGTLRGVVDPRPASFRVDATLEGVDLARYTGARPWLDGSLRGRLEGALLLDGAGRGAAAATGTITLHVPGLTLEGGKVRGITVPDLHFADVHLNGSVKNGRLEITELVADGQEIGLRGEGNVLLRNPLDGSVLSLALVITPATGASDGLKMLVNMLPGTSGDGGARRISIIGTLGRPTLR